MVNPILTLDKEIQEQYIDPLNLWVYDEHQNETAFGLRIKGYLHSEKTPFQKLDMIDSAGFGRVLLLDGIIMTTEKDEFVYHEMISHVALNCHPNPQNVLIIGGGDGGTLREVVKHQSVVKATMCEIDEAVVNASKKYLPTLSSAFAHPKTNLVIGDGVKFVKDHSPASFDVIIVDSTDPLGPGVGLFSEDFYKDVGRILKPDGIVVAQCETPWDDIISLDKVFNNLKSACNHVYTFVGTVPSYQKGYWAWGFASNTINPLKDLNEAKAQQIGATCKYYNREVHRAAFALPNFVKERLKSVITDPYA
jgi:spermidine synthase